MNKITRKTSAFTLIDLLMVIAIIGILAGILIPTVGAVRKQANIAASKSQLSNYVTAIQLFKGEYSYYPFVTGGADKTVDLSSQSTEFIETLSAPARNNIFTSSIDEIPPPTVNGIFTLLATFSTISTKVFLLSLVAVISKNTNSSAPSFEYLSANSTGSPASLKPTKFTPFTVRPSLISKQGMILFVNIITFRHPELVSGSH